MSKATDRDFLTQIELKALLNYDQNTGHFTWKSDGYNKTHLKGERITYIRSGYIAVWLKQRHFLAHRLAWLYMTGEFPPEGLQVDHTDGDKLNNAFINLRLVTPSQNGQNSVGFSTRSTKVKGLSYVEFRKDKPNFSPTLNAKIKLEGKSYCKSLTLSGDMTKEKAEVILTLWLKETRERLHGIYANHG
jgi:hypothetical protein